MKTDIQIAQEAQMAHIRDVAANVGVMEEELEFYGKYKAKLSDEVWERIKDRPDGKLVLVTAINPTPAGEGKTTTTVGLGQALAKLDKKAIIALREPSLGPCFGIKGGAAGGGYAQVVPMEDLNLHFTGDFHAITSANNLLAAMLDNHIQQGNALKIDPRQVIWKRCLDMNDRNLRNIVVGLGSKMDGMVREDHFVITVASEIMAILCLAEDIRDLKERLGKIIVAYNFSGDPVTAEDLQATGAMTALLKDAIKPNLIQTLEHTPALVHGGPFANIAHGCNSVRATRMALKLSDITVTEAGFGADLGAEKFLDIKCRKAGFKPDAVVLVATVRALKYNGGVAREDLSKENLDALAKGIVNLEKHIENIQKYDVPVVVTLNSFVTDTEAENEYIRSFCEKRAVNSRCPRYGRRAARAVLLWPRRYFIPLRTRRVISILFIRTSCLWRRRSRRSPGRYTAQGVLSMSRRLRSSLRRSHPWDSAVFRSAWRRISILCLMTRRSWDALWISISISGKYMSAPEPDS